MRRSDSGHSRRDVSNTRNREKSGDRSGQERRQHQSQTSNVTRSGSVKRFSSQHQTSDKTRGDWSRARETRDWVTDDNTWTHDRGQDRRRWGWAGNEFDINNNNNNNNSNSSRGYSLKQQHPRHTGNDYVDMSSMETSSTTSDTSSMATTARHQQQRRQEHADTRYNKIYVRHRGPAVSRSRSMVRPSPPRSKSVGHGHGSSHGSGHGHGHGHGHGSSHGHGSGQYPSRTHSFTSIYETRSAGYSKTSGGGTSLDLRPLRTSLSSQGIFFTETGHLPSSSSHHHQPSYQHLSDAGPMSISLQDLQTSAFTTTR